MVTMKKIKVLQIGMSSVYGGTEAYLINQYRKIDKNKLEYDFLDLNSFGKEMCFTEEIKKNNKVFRVDSNRKKNPIKFYLSILKIMSKIATEYDAVIYNVNGLNLVFPILAAKLFGSKKIIVHSHNSGEMDGKNGKLVSIIRKLNKKMLNMVVDERVACSSRAGKYLFDDRKFTIIKNGIDLDRYKYNAHKRHEIRVKYNLGNSFVMGHIGRFSYQKNQEFLIDIFKEVHAHIDESRLLIVGDENSDIELSKTVHDKVRLYNLEDVVIFAGMNSNTEDYYSAFDCFVLPSRFEGLPLVGIEAQASGLPCFFSDTISDELRITELANFISIRESPMLWYEKILNNRNDKRDGIYRELKKKGYDIDSQIDEILKILHS